MKKFLPKKIPIRYKNLMKKFLPKKNPNKVKKYIRHLSLMIMLLTYSYKFTIQRYEEIHYIIITLGECLRLIFLSLIENISNLKKTKNPPKEGLTAPFPSDMI